MSRGGNRLNVGEVNVKDKVDVISVSTCGDDLSFARRETLFGRTHLCNIESWKDKIIYEEWRVHKTSFWRQAGARVFPCGMSCQIFDCSCVMFWALL